MTSASQEIRPGRFWYAVAALLLAAGVASFAILLIGFITRIDNVSQSMTRVVAPGTSDITLSQPGSYTIYDEYRSVVGGRIYSNPGGPGGLGGLTCKLTDKATGRDIPISATSGSTSYDMGSYAGRAIFDFTIPSPGVYTVSAQYADGAAGPESVLAVGHGLLANILGLIATMFGAVGALLISILLATLIFAITLVKRSAAKKRRRSEA